MTKQSAQDFDILHIFRTCVNFHCLHSLVSMGNRVMQNMQLKHRNMLQNFSRKPTININNCFPDFLLPKRLRLQAANNRCCPRFYLYCRFSRCMMWQVSAVIWTFECFPLCFGKRYCCHAQSKYVYVKQLLETVTCLRLS